MQSSTPDWANKGERSGKQALNDNELYLFIYNGILFAILTGMKETANNSERGRKDARNSRSTDIRWRNMGGAYDPLYHYRDRLDQVQRALNCCKAIPDSQVSGVSGNMAGATMHKKRAVSTSPRLGALCFLGLSAIWLAGFLIALVAGAWIVCRWISQGKERAKREYLKSK